MSCLVPVETVNGATRRRRSRASTPADGALAPLQQAFLDGFATQCGFCTPGMIMAAEALLAANPTRPATTSSSAISGNVCRCTGYESDHRRDPRRRASARRRCRIDTSTYFAGERNGDSTSSARPSSARTRSATSPAARSSSRTQPAGLLHLKMHRSERHHARIDDVDTSAALKVPGVVRVLTHKDVPNNWYTILKLIRSSPTTSRCWPRTRSASGRADRRRRRRRPSAPRARAPPRSRSTTRTCPPSSTSRRRSSPGAPVIKPHGHNYFIYEGHHCRRIRFGDVEKGFAEADHVFEWRYQSAPIEHAPTETTGCIVVPAGATAA